MDYGLQQGPVIDIIWNQSSPEDAAFYGALIYCRHHSAECDIDLTHSGL